MITLRNFTMTLATAGVFAVSAAASAQASMSAQDFVTKASIANKFEIETSKLALEKSSNDDVKGFAQQMVDDHTAAGQKLKATLQISQSGAKPAPALDSDHQKQLDKLEADSSDKFDKDYVKMQTKAHKQAVDLFSDYAKDGKDQPLKQFAGDTLPTLKAHLQHIEQLKSNY